MWLSFNPCCCLYYMNPGIFFLRFAASPNWPKKCLQLRVNPYQLQKEKGVVAFALHSPKLPSLSLSVSSLSPFETLSRWNRLLKKYYYLLAKYFGASKSTIGQSLIKKSFHTWFPNTVHDENHSHFLFWICCGLGLFLPERTSGHHLLGHILRHLFPYILRKTVLESHSWNNNNMMMLFRLEDKTPEEIPPSKQKRLSVIPPQCNSA